MIGGKLLTAEERDVRSRAVTALVFDVASHLLSVDEMDVAREYLRRLQVEAKRSRDLDSAVQEFRSKVPRPSG